MQFAFTIQPISVRLMGSNMGGKGEEMYFEKLLFYKWRYERTGGSTSCHQITGVIAEKLLIVFHCASEFIYTVFNICNPTTAPLFVCSNSKKKYLCCQYPWNKKSMSNLSRV